MLLEFGVEKKATVAPGKCGSEFGASGVSMGTVWEGIVAMPGLEVPLRPWPASVSDDGHGEGAVKHRESLRGRRKGKNR